MKKLLIAAAFSAAFMAGPAFAQAYLGAGGGRAHTDTSENSWKGYAGFQFNPTWGLEAGYSHLGAYHGSNVSSWSLAGTGTIPLGDRWSLLGKAGASLNKPHATGASSHTGLLLGGGAEYAFTKHVAMRLEYEYLGKLSVNTPSDSKGTNTTLSAKFTF
jgi:OOP family OmpA-OmpF porin